MIGKKVRVFWPVDNSWYTGVVQKYNAESGEHLLRYDDNDEEWVKIGESSSGTNAAGQAGAEANPPLTGGTSGERISPIPAVPPPHGGEMYDPNAWQHGRPYPLPYSAAQQGQGPAMAYPSPAISGGAAYPYPPYTSVAYYPPPILSMPPASVPAPVSATTKATKAKKVREEDGPSPTPSDLSARKKNGPRVWTKEEDSMLLALVQGMRMPMKWSVVAQSMPDRTGKQCRERYVNHLNPRLKTSDWSPVEDATIFHLYSTGGSHWAKMAKMIPGRTDNGMSSTE